MTEEQIRHMVSRFLQWSLPEDFNPDCGISFQKYYNENSRNPGTFRPVGTNLFDANQADAMVRHMLEGMPDRGGPVFPRTLRAGDNELTEGGMDLRDWLAGQALSAIVAQGCAGSMDTIERELARRCYALADAMIAVRGQ